jgi:ABC-type multidrug transport system fused ATPase/permease subunit
MASPGILREQPNRLATMIWALRRTWRISKALLALVLLSGLLRSLVPLGLALAGRELINAVSAGDRERGMIWLGASMVLALLMALALALFKFSSQRLRDKLDLEIVSDLMQLVSSLEFAMLDSITWNTHPLGCLLLNRQGLLFRSPETLESPVTNSSGFSLNGSQIFNGIRLVGSVTV